MNKIEWEQIYEDSDHVRDDITYRAKVIGGWMVRHRNRVGEDGENCSMVFIPDANHNWELWEIARGEKS